ncbi:MAG: hypothetical protein LBU67_08605, partial [Oscillospiraceae bacterium]|jgi:hypothetical protein|nr:hypothetical protein [Oscillospiraceae bacterium]
VVLDTQAESLATDCERFVLAMYAVIQVVDPTLDGAEAITLAKQLSLRIGDGKASVTRTSLRGVAYELTVEPAAMRACFRTVPAIAAYRDGED